MPRAMTDSDKLMVGGLFRAQAALRVMFQAAQPSSSLGRLVHNVTLKASMHASSIAPMLTGILRSSHRERMLEAALGEVHIDPHIINPILGGKPVEYGPRVHRKPGKDWMRQTAEDDSQKFVNEAIQYWIMTEVDGRMP